MKMIYNYILGLHIQPQKYVDFIAHMSWTLNSCGKLRKDHIFR